MKKRIALFRNCMPLLMSLIIITSSNAQFDQPDTPGPGDVQGYHKLIEDIDNRSVDANIHEETISFNFKVNLVNLVCSCMGKPCEPNCPSHRVTLSYPYEQDYPTMYARYKIGDYDSRIKEIHLGSFEPNLEDTHIHSFSDGEDHGHHQVFQSVITSNPIPLTCENNPVLVSFEIMEYVQGEYRPYPIHEFSGQGDIFECHIFDEMDCGIPCEPGAGVSCPNASFGYLSLCAEDWINLIGEPFTGSESNVEFRSSVESIFIDDFKVGPNPFVNEINYSYQLLSDQNIELTLFDTEGNEVYSKKKFLKKGSIEDHIHTNKLIPGVYFIQLKTEEKSMVLKVFKL